MEMKKALVTGAAGIMGTAVTEMFIGQGYSVVLADIDEDRLNKLHERWPEQTYPLRVDVSRYEEVQEGIAKMQADVGTVDILVNNAGVFSSTKIRDINPEEWHRVMAINLDSALYVSKFVLPGMIEKSWGRIINVSSYGAKSGGITAGTAYAVSKGAMITLTYSLAAETFRTGVTVNAIAPAWVKTPMVTDLSPEEQQATIQKIPVGRFCEPEEFAHVVDFLASPKAGYITGEIVDLNGGIHFD